jgi:hypothetical protein
MVPSAPSHEFGDAAGGHVERCEEDSMKAMLGGRP